MPGRITQPTSIRTEYRVNPNDANNSGQIGNRTVRTQPGKAKRVLGFWQRDAGRVRRNRNIDATKRGGWFKKAEVKADMNVSQRAVRFNKRHAKFSTRVGANVHEFSKANFHDRSSALKTLRNDLKMLTADNPHVDEFDLLQSRLDIELSKLDADGLQDFADNVDGEIKRLESHTFSGRRHGRDIAMLKQMKFAALRQHIARGNLLHNVFIDIDGGNKSH